MVSHEALGHLSLVEEIHGQGEAHSHQQSHLVVTWGSEGDQEEHQNPEDGWVEQVEDKLGKVGLGKATIEDKEEG